MSVIMIFFFAGNSCYPNIKEKHNWRWVKIMIILLHTEKKNELTRNNFSQFLEDFF